MTHATNPWRDEILILCTVLAMLWLLGQGLNLGGFAILSGVLAYLGWHLYHLAQLIGWLRNVDRRVPRAAGLWDYVFYRLEVTRREYNNNIDQLHSQIHEYSQTAQALPFATVALNRQFEITGTNNQAARLLGIRQSDRGQTLDNLLREPRFLSYLRMQDFSGAIELPSPRNENRTLSYQVIQATRDQYLLIARDISERKSLENAQRDFVANVSHELRTPLTVMQGALEQMDGFADEVPALTKPLQWMERQTQRMVTLVEELLRMARLERERAIGMENNDERVNVSAVLAVAIQESKALSAQFGGHDLHVDIHPNIELFGTEQALNAAMLNLITNAVRYTPAGGRIDISLRRQKDGVRFSVTDTGTGIAGRHLSRLTERFYRVDEGRSRDRGGTGLGLSIVKHVLDGFGSKLEIQSTLGAGSTFSFVIGSEWLGPEDS